MSITPPREGAVPERPRIKRGLGSPNYNPQRAREVRRLGIQAVAAQGKAHRWTTYEEASAAGQKGGDKAAANRRETKREAA